MILKPNLSKLPPGGLSWTDNVTGETFSTAAHGVRNPRAIARRVIRARKLKTGQTDDLRTLERQISLEICERLSPESREAFCVKERLGRTIGQNVTGGLAATEITRRGEAAFVPLSEAEARAKLCAHCPQNQQLATNQMEKLGDDLLSAAAGGRSTSRDSRLYHCRVCSCPLRPKVHLALDIAQIGLVGDQEQIDATPAFCWRLKGLQQSLDADGKNYEPPNSCASCG